MTTLESPLEISIPLITITSPTLAVPLLQNGYQDRIAACIADWSLKSPHNITQTPQDILDSWEQWIILAHAINHQVAAVCRSVPHAGNWREMASLMVDPLLQNTLVSKRLFHQFTDGTQTQNFAIVQASNTPAKKFFTKMGAEESDQFPAPIRETQRDTKDRVCFVWQA
ncbi:MAG TPA: hypothetical protein VIT68_03820 [Candidatus Gracilibacteria bacterium]